MVNLTKQLIAHVDTKIAEKFQDMLEERGQVQRRVMETLLKVWLALPIELQAKLQDKSTSDFYSALVEGLVEPEIAKNVGALELSEKIKLLALLKQTTP